MIGALTWQRFYQSILVYKYIIGISGGGRVKGQVGRETLSVKLAERNQVLPLPPPCPLPCKTQGSQCCQGRGYMTSHHLLYSSRCLGRRRVLTCYRPKQRFGFPRFCLPCIQGHTHIPRGTRHTYVLNK